MQSYDWCIERKIDFIVCFATVGIQNEISIFIRQRKLNTMIRGMIDTRYKKSKH
jgi:hypothetical protein